jgi:hypothetical protein
MTMLPEILLVIGFVLALVVIALGAYFLLSGAVPDVEDPQPLPITPVSTPVVPKPAPVGETVRVRYVDAKGRVLGEQRLDRRQRRPQLVYVYGKTQPQRGVFACSHLQDGVWVYRCVGVEREH